jgi:catechol 2,3-dioxygenase-like lactoylglutathione lyase family enzyme
MSEYTKLEAGASEVPAHRGDRVSSPFRTLHHVCIVVHDMARALAYYEGLGIGPWYDYPKGEAYVAFDVPNPQASKAMRYKCADLDNVQLQLCEPPRMDCPQRRFLDAHGEGVYHLGFEVPDLGIAKAAMHAVGVAATASGERADGSGFAYFDTRGGAGVTLEVRRSAK